MKSSTMQAVIYRVLRRLLSVPVVALTGLVLSGSLSAQLNLPEITLTPGTQQTQSITVASSKVAEKITWSFLNPNSAAYAVLGKTTATDTTSSVAVFGLTPPVDAKPPVIVLLAMQDGKVIGVCEIKIKYEAPTVQKSPDKFTLELSARDENNAILTAKSLTPDTPLRITASVDSTTRAEIPKIIWNLLLNSEEKKHVFLSQDANDSVRLLASSKDITNAPDVIPVEARIGDGTVAVFTVRLKKPETVSIPSAKMLDADYAILPYDQVKKAFGGNIAKEYYAIHANVSNFSGSDVRVTSMAFESGSKTNPTRIVPVPYGIVRTGLAHKKMWNWRTMFLGGITSFGQLMLGFNPLFFNESHQNRFKTFIGIGTIPGRDVVENTIPDTQTAYMQNLDNLAGRAVSSVLNSGGEPIQGIVFIPKSAVPSVAVVETDDETGDSSTDDSVDQTVKKGQETRRVGERQQMNGVELERKGREDLTEIKRRLGKLTIKGFEIERTMTTKVLN